MPTILRYFPTLAIVLSLLGAGSSAVRAQANYELHGKMVHTTIEGGCWYLEAEDGKHYELTGDPSIVDPLRVEDKQVNIMVHDTKGMASICMVGKIVEVVQNLDGPRYPVDLVIAWLNLDGKMHRSKAGYWYIQTKEGAKYNFEKLPPAKYRKVGARVKTSMRVLVHNKPINGMSGTVLARQVRDNR